MADEAHFDALLGGTEELPSSLNLAKFIACRSQEIQTMKNSLISQSGTKLAFQTLPKHIRRRAMSHNVKRLPRRLRQIHLNQMKKSGMPTKQKRPSRKYRRRPRNLLEEYTSRANKKYKWLQTHIWHAKRFHMVEKWGYKLPYRSCDKAFRACYRAMTQHCLLQDLSYYNCIEISGHRQLIIEKFKQMCKSDNGLSIGAKAFTQGNREGEVILCETEKAIGPVNFHWKPNCHETVSKLWIWVHAAFHGNVKTVLTKYFADTENVTFSELDTDLCRFRLTGPLSNSILHDALIVVNTDDIDTVPLLLKNYICSPDNRTLIMDQCKYWHELPTTTEISPHTILSLVVEDPRLNLPKKRLKSVPQSRPCADCNLPANLSISPLWDAKIRKVVNESRVPDMKLAELQSKILVPGSSLGQSGTLIPLIFVQRPGNKKENIGLGGGWDIILPRAWAKSFWIAFVMRGARTGGLRESNSMLFEMGKSQFLQPDTKAGAIEDCNVCKENTEKFFKKPPNKRVNYNKFRIVSPFSCNWKLLLQDWNKSNNVDNFSVLRNRRTLSEIDLFLNSKTKFVPDCPKNCLIPVKLQCEKRGSPSQFAIICLPQSKNDFGKLISEPNYSDELQRKRKELRQIHQSILKKLRKQRKVKPKLYKAEIHKEELENYTRKMRALWLPQPVNIRNSCSREVIGFIQKGGFSFSVGKSCATGYITSDSLTALVNFRKKVLFRNTNSKQYRVANLSVILE